MLIVSGFNVFPKEIENIILQISVVKDVGVVGAPSHSTGEKPFSFVVLEDGQSISAKEITEFCYIRLVHYKTPKDIMFLNELNQEPCWQSIKGRT